MISSDATTHPRVQSLLDSAGPRVFAPDASVDVAATLEWCARVGTGVPCVGDGHTHEVWDLVAATAARDVTVARILEPHLDALSILEQARSGQTQAGETSPALASELAAIGVTGASTWGVFAAEAPGARVTATRGADGWVLSGTKAWCSLAARLSHALVTAWIDDDNRGLFAVDLRAAGVHAHDRPWLARGLTDVVSAPVDFDAVRAVAVGEAGWYLSRPGFAWGGISVAACWWGGAVGLARALEKPARSERADQLAHVSLGRADAALWAARASLAEAAHIIDTTGASASPREAKLLAARVRTIVADAASLVLSQCDAALGPAPLVSDAAHARRVADLHLYLRQHHGDRDVARIGRDIVAELAR